MECTQRIECTQDVYETSSERTCPEQIGFLGICGAKYPIKKGPNKIGRDPQTCGIILNDNSISRQHAVINILNKKVFMLMDLDSSNKTKLLDKSLQPYIPHPLKNGDTVQFGQVFGIFRLLEEDDDLPMTQAVEIPDTPVNIRHVPKLKPATIPESPDVRDRDDSMIGQSQPQKKSHFKSPNNSFSKSLAKVTQKIGTNKIDNVYWHSSKKSNSFNSTFVNDSSLMLNKSSVSPKKISETSIYDMETQAPVHPNINETSDSIYEANTQVPVKCASQNIYTAETQAPNIEKLPEVFKVRDQSNVQLNLFATRENFNIFDAETQVQEKDKRVSPILAFTKDNSIKKSEEDSSITKKLNSSDEEICFDEIDFQPVEQEECGSQTLLPPDIHETEQGLIKDVNIENNRTSNNAIIHDSDSRDCDEIAPSQVLPEKRIDDEDLTDCEDNMIELKVNTVEQPNKIKNDDDVTDCEDNLNNVEVSKKPSIADDNDLTDCEDELIEISQNRSKANNLIQSFEDLPTQVITEDLTNHDKEKEHQPANNDLLFEDMLTQVIEECPVVNKVNTFVEKNSEVSINDLQTQVIESDNVLQESSLKQKLVESKRTFKYPLPSPRLKKRDTLTLKNCESTKVAIKDRNAKEEGNDNYYDATQQIYIDLCSQNENLDPSLKNNLSSGKNVFIRDRSSEESNTNENMNNFVSNLSKEQVREVIGADVCVVPLSKNKSSDSSDVEVTPKKFNLSKFLLIDLPNSQEIKSCNFVSSKVDATDSSDGFEELEEQDNKTSPARSHKKRRKKDIKLDLMKKFDIDTLPTRAITRIRKPTSKILDSDDKTKKMTAKILQSNLGIDKEHEIDAEVMHLNLKRLRSKMEKAKNKTKSNISVKDSNKTESKDITIETVSSKNDQTEPTKFKIPLRSEKVLKQQNIKSMFNESSSKDVSVIEARDRKTEPTENSHEGRRSTRNRNKSNKTDEIISKSKESIPESSDIKNKSSRVHRSSRKKETVTSLPEKEEEPVTRRSTRHQTTRNSKEDTKQATKHKKEDNKHVSKYKKDDKKEKHKRSKDNPVAIQSESSPTVIDKSIRSSDSSNTEQSRVYNLSTETTVDSPSLKRKVTSEIVPSKSKKSKSCSVSAPVRSTPARGTRTQYVLFTAFPCEEVKVKLEKLGAVIVSDVNSCTVVLTLQIRRTFKLLCALGLGKPIVGPNWVQACADSNMIVDPWLYLMKDEATEKRFGFNLRQSLTCARNFLRGLNVSCTPNVTPSAEEMKLIVECSGGTWREGGRAWYCVSCGADRALWPALRARGATVVSTEFILGGVLQQKINLDRDQLK